jgi:hypothetical protein
MSLFYAYSLATATSKEAPAYSLRILYSSSKVAFHVTQLVPCARPDTVEHIGINEFLLGLEMILIITAFWNIPTIKVACPLL